VDNGEGGLLGIAVGPRFAEDRWVYFYFTSSTDNRIVRKRYRDGSLGRTEVVLDGIPASSNHNGGRLAFGPDGMLYASTGDAGGTSRAQDKNSLGGKILRMTPSCGVPDGTRSTAGCGRTVTATSRGSPGTPTVGCGPRSWARTPATS
jgi:glucose/arabinose dehydrogenase